MLLLRSQVYNLLLYALIIVMGILYLIPSIISRKAALHGIRLLCRINRWMLRSICNIHQEVRGNVPTENALICSKHMSFLDIIMLAEVLPEPKFVMKDSLKYVPIFGFYAMRIGSAPVKRGTGSKAVDKMVDDLDDEREGQMVIYPQGTRVLPGQKLPYKRGAAALYSSFDLPTYMVATNIGVLWARRSAYRYPGLAIIEFLDQRIEPGMPPKEFMALISDKIETRSDELMEAYPANYDFSSDKAHKL